jgi:hypothetical protein
VVWREEHLKKSSVLQRVHLSYLLVFLSLFPPLFSFVFFFLNHLCLPQYFTIHTVSVFNIIFLSFPLVCLDVQFFLYYSETYLHSAAVPSGSGLVRLWVNHVSQLYLTDGAGGNRSIGRYILKHFQEIPAFITTASHLFVTHMNGASSQATQLEIVLTKPYKSEQQALHW